jgi:hypothetical protein
VKPKTETSIDRRRLITTRFLGNEHTKVERSAVREATRKKYVTAGVRSGIGSYQNNVTKYTYKLM